MNANQLVVYSRVIEKASYYTPNDDEIQPLLDRIASYGINTDPVTVFVFLSAISGFECQECHYAPPDRCWITQYCKYCSSMAGKPITFDGEEEMIQAIADIKELAQSAA